MGLRSKNKTNKLNAYTRNKRRNKKKMKTNKRHLTHKNQHTRKNVIGGSASGSVIQPLTLNTKTQNILKGMVDCLEKTYNKRTSQYSPLDNILYNIYKSLTTNKKPHDMLQAEESPILSDIVLLCEQETLLTEYIKKRDESYNAAELAIEDYLNFIYEIVMDKLIPHHDFDPTKYTSNFALYSNFIHDIDITGMTPKHTPDSIVYYYFVANKLSTHNGGGEGTHGLAQNEMPQIVQLLGYGILTYIDIKRKKVQELFKIQDNNQAIQDFCKGLWTVTSKDEDLHIIYDTMSKNIFAKIEPEMLKGFNNDMANILSCMRRQYVYCGEILNLNNIINNFTSLTFRLPINNITLPDSYSAVQSTYDILRNVIVNPFDTLKNFQNSIKKKTNEIVHNLLDRIDNCHIKYIELLGCIDLKYGPKTLKSIVGNILFDSIINTTGNIKQICETARRFNTLYNSSLENELFRRSHSVPVQPTQIMSQMTRLGSDPSHKPASLRLKAKAEAAAAAARAEEEARLKAEADAAVATMDDEAAEINNENNENSTNGSANTLIYNDTDIDINDNENNEIDINDNAQPNSSMTSSSHHMGVATSGSVKRHAQDYLLHAKRGKASAEA